MKNFEYLSPATLDDASKAASVPGTLLKAGGIDVLDLMKAYVASPDRVVNLLSVPGLRSVSPADGVIRIGALVTLAELGDSRSVPAALAEAAAEAATPQIRNVATVGGNLCQRPRCWYFRNSAFHCTKKGGKSCFALDGENRYHAIFRTGTCSIVHPSNLAAPFLALGAEVVTDRRTIKMGDFFVGPDQAMERENVLEPGEIITEVTVPDRPRGSAYREARERSSFDWALVSAAVVLERDGDKVREARVVLGSVAPVPWRVPAAESELAGKVVDPGTAAKAAAAAFAGATPLSGNAYKVPMGKAILKRAILAAAGVGEKH